MRGFYFSGLVLLILLVGSCRTVQNSDTKLRDLAFNSEKSVRNVAIFFSAPRPVNNSAVGIDSDPESIIEGLTALDQNFHTYKNESATTAVVKTWLKAVSGPEYLSDDGTLFIYIGAHGAPTAQAQMSDGTFVDFNIIANAIKAGRSNKPLKRLILMVFGCYSGSWINTVHKTDFSGVSEQIFVLTSSTPNQYSYFGGYNSQLVQAFQTAMNSYADSKGTVTLQKFTDDIRRNVSGSTPWVYAKPQSILKEPLFNKETVALYKAAADQGIMPTPEEFAAGRRSPSKATIEANLYSVVAAKQMCWMDIVKGAKGTDFCSAWNQEDHEAGRTVAAHVVARPANSAHRCDAQLIYKFFKTPEAYEKFYQQCGGTLRAVKK